MSKLLYHCVVFFQHSPIHLPQSSGMQTSIISSWSVKDFVVNKGNGVKGLSGMGLDSLPKQYIQPLEERFSMLSKVEPEEESVPVIDMSHANDNDEEMTKLICGAAEKWGFFQIVNHGVPIEVLENVKEATHLFFGLPAEEKKKYSKEHFTSTKNVHFGTSFSPKVEKVLEWKDYLSFLYVSEDEASSLWPPICRDQVLEYIKGTEPLIKRLLKALLKGLNVIEIVVGVGRHSDIPTLTVLLQDDIGGLYARGINENSWIHIPPIAGSLVINVGDALQIMTNGRYKSAEHLVIANESKNRVSVPIFVNPGPSEIIHVLPEALSDGEKPIYKQVLYSDYTLAEFYTY